MVQHTEDHLASAPLCVAIMVYPHACQLDEFQSLALQAHVQVHWVREAAQWEQIRQIADCVILPHSSQVIQDLAWLRQHALDQALAQYADLYPTQQVRICGIGAGLRMLCEALIDVDDWSGNVPGLGLLPLVSCAPTTPEGASPAWMHRREHPEPFQSHQFAHVRAPWQALSGISVQAEVIAHGLTQAHPAMAAAGNIAVEILPHGLGWQNKAGHVLGWYVCGVLKRTEFF